MEMASRDDFEARGIGSDVSLLVPKEKKKPPKPVQFRPPPELVAEIDAARRPLNLSRNEAMTKLLRMGLEEHKKELAKKRGAKDH